MNSHGLSLPKRRLPDKYSHWMRLRTLLVASLPARGTSGQRPAGAFHGTYFDTTLGYPIWKRDDGVWVNSTGVAV